MNGAHCLTRRASDLTCSKRRAALCRHLRAFVTTNSNRRAAGKRAGAIPFRAVTRLGQLRTSPENFSQELRVRISVRIMNTLLDAGRILVHVLLC